MNERAHCDDDFCDGLPPLHHRPGNLASSRAILLLSSRQAPVGPRVLRGRGQRVDALACRVMPEDGG
jgi:hypothetical protein